MPDTDEKATPIKKVKKVRSNTQERIIKRATNAAAAYKTDKAKMPKESEKDAAAIRDGLKEIAEKEARRTELMTEAERLTGELTGLYATVRKHTANLGRTADNVHGVGSVEAKAYRNDD